jgi:hypothetical protein
MYSNDSQFTNCCYSISIIRFLQVSQFHEMIDSQKRTMFLFRWECKLLFTPSQMILNTGIALSVTLVVIAVVLALLQYREKVCSNEEVMNKCWYIF